MSSQTKLSKKITAVLKDLFPGHKFKLSFQEHQPEHFGNEIIEYEFEDFLMYMIKDRNELFVELAPKNSPNKHSQLPKLLESIGAAKASDFTEHDFKSVTNQLELLSRNFPKIQNGLNIL
ncbi:MAG TPA: hypothetical protein VK892_22975 [Pyrinomonadaceae bacterium]|nr:hypothetical protein [Pyrinomonadaceae bacterium]